MRIEPIERPTDPRVAEYRDLPDPRLRIDRGLFVAEGRDIVRRLMADRRYRVRSILGTRHALEDLRDAIDALAEAPSAYLAAPTVIRALVGYHFHRGCLALAERGVPERVEALVDPPGARTLLLLENVTNPDNVGGLFRNALAFGVDGVLLSERCADPLYRKTLRVSVGASLQLPWARASRWSSALDALRAAGYAVAGLTPDGSVEVDELAAKRPAIGRLALIVGAEDRGLGAETRARCDAEVRIAMAPGADSLNVATAAGIALSRLWQRRLAPR